MRVWIVRHADGPILKGKKEKDDAVEWAEGSKWDMDVLEIKGVLCD